MGEFIMLKNEKKQISKRNKKAAQFLILVSPQQHPPKNRLPTQTQAK